MKQDPVDMCASGVYIRIFTHIYCTYIHVHIYKKIYTYLLDLIPMGKILSVFKLFG